MLPAVAQTAGSSLPGLAQFVKLPHVAVGQGGLLRARPLLDPDLPFPSLTLVRHGSDMDERDGTSAGGETRSQPGMMGGKPRWTVARGTGVAAPSAQRRMSTHYSGIDQPQETLRLAPTRALTHNTQYAPWLAMSERGPWPTRVEWRAVAGPPEALDSGPKPSSWALCPADSASRTGAGDVWHR